MRIAKSLLLGTTVGIAFHSVVALVACYWLRLGYYMPFVASLPEQVGGELNAASVQMLISATIGSLISMVYFIIKQRLLSRMCNRRKQERERYDTASAFQYWDSITLPTTK